MLNYLYFTARELQQEQRSDGRLKIRFSCEELAGFSTWMDTGTVTNLRQYPKSVVTAGTVAWCCFERSQSKPWLFPDLSTDN